MIIPFFIPHRGCPNLCVFCNQKRISGESRNIAASDVRRTIEEYLASREEPFEEAAFYGGTFASLPEEIQEELLGAAGEYVDRGLLKGIRISTRPDSLDAEKISFLKNRMVTTVELGVQSMDNRVLAASRRGHTARDTETASLLVKEAGLRLGHQVMPGLPGDTVESIFDTFRRSAGLEPDLLRIYPTVVVKDTELADMYGRGEYIPWETYRMAEIVAEGILIYSLKATKIIRIGLQKTDDFNWDDSVLAGPFHTSFGEIAKSRVLRRIAFCLLRKDDENPVISCNGRNLSQLQGIAKENIRGISREMGRSVQIRIDDGVPYDFLKVNGKIMGIKETALAGLKPGGEDIVSQKH